MTVYRSLINGCAGHLLSTTNLGKYTTVSKNNAHRKSRQADKRNGATMGYLLYISDVAQPTAPWKASKHAVSNYNRPAAVAA